MATTKTRDQYVDRILQKLGVVGAGQSADAEDQELVDGTVDATFADLSARNVYLVQDDDAIPVEAFEWLADCGADNVAVDFGRQRDPQKMLYVESRLKKISAVPPSYLTAQNDYF